MPDDSRRVATIVPLCSALYRSILTRSTQHAEQVQNQRDEHDCPNYPKAPAPSLSGIPIVAAACAEQQQQNNNQ
jgi:hypothetical protein